MPAAIQANDSQAMTAASFFRLDVLAMDPFSVHSPVKTLPTLAFTRPELAKGMYLTNTYIQSGDTLAQTACL